MSIQYDLYDTPDIQQTGDAQPLHPRVVFKGTVDQEEFLDRVHKFTGISRSLLAGAMQSFQNELRDLIANGWIVELGDIGYFSVSLKGPRVMKKKDVHAQSIELKNVNFRVSRPANETGTWRIDDSSPQKRAQRRRMFDNNQPASEQISLPDPHRL